MNKQHYGAKYKINKRDCLSGSASSLSARHSVRVATGLDSQECRVLGESRFELPFVLDRRVERFYHFSRMKVTLCCDFHCTECFDKVARIQLYW